MSQGQPEGQTKRSRALSQPNPQPSLPFCENKRITRSVSKIREMMGGNDNEPKESGKGDNGENNRIPEVKDPESITPATWLSMFNQLNATLSNLSDEIKDLKSLKGKVEHYSNDWKSTVDGDIASHDRRLDSDKFRINLMTNMIINQEERIKILENRVTAAFQREIKPNLIIHGVIEDKEEDRESLFEKVNVFFKTQMEIESKIEIRDAYRLGQGVARPILIKLCYSNDKAIIFENASKLKGKENVKKKLYFIHDDMSDEQTETRQFYRELNQENALREENDKLQIKMRKGRITVNNEVIKQRVEPPHKADILRMSEDEMEEIRSTKLVPGPTHMEKNSEFLSYAVKVKNTDQVLKAYYKLRIKHADALHISCGYRFESAIGPFRQEAIDDKDYGIGRAILRTLKVKDESNIAVFMVRYYGGEHLGKRRFEIVENLADKAVGSWRRKTAAYRKRSQRQMSQTSLLSLASNVESQDELSDTPN